MRIGAVGFTPYIYHVNALSGSSLSKVSSIGDDLLSAKTDFSSLTEEGLNENPLKKGQTSDFAAVLDSQMSAGRRNASRIMKEEAELSDLEEAGEVFESANADDEREAAVRKAPAFGAGQETPERKVKAREDFSPVIKTEEMFNRQEQQNLFRMRHAAQAYQMNMFM